MSIHAKKKQDLKKHPSHCKDSLSGLTWGPPAAQNSQTASGCWSCRCRRRPRRAPPAEADPQVDPAGDQSLSHPSCCRCRWCCGCCWRRCWRLCEGSVDGRSSVTPVSCCRGCYCCWRRYCCRRLCEGLADGRSSATPVSFCARGSCLRLDLLIWSESDFAGVRSVCLRLDFWDRPNSWRPWGADEERKEL